ncbi:UNVERIFIED_CONTAM: chaperonin [Sesamum calycinum]|uniref:Chaperonin n=1 Tax=Sesamum calycinum TaxID=2727403 RepID=A0AAW2J3Y9_9LAMI
MVQKQKRKPLLFGFYFGYEGRQRTTSQYESDYGMDAVVQQQLMIELKERKTSGPRMSSTDDGELSVQPPFSSCEPKQLMKRVVNMVTAVEIPTPLPLNNFVASGCQFMNLLAKYLWRRLCPHPKPQLVFLPEKSSKLNSGKVVAVGPGLRGEAAGGNHIPVAVKEGDTVLLPEYGGTQVKLGEKEYHLYRDEDILGTLHD